MFSGIVEEMGTVTKVQKKKNLYIITVRAHRVLRGTKIGDSICVDGICLTVTQRTKQALSFDIMKETIRATTLQSVRPGMKVNLERSLKMSSRISGHFVTGHIEGIGTIKKMIKAKNYVEIHIAYPKELWKFLVHKGSVAVDGISLTVGTVTRKYFSIYLIPHTLDITTIGIKKVSDKVNIETDMLAKYILKERLT
jgi:riboflavin synthase